MKQNAGLLSVLIADDSALIRERLVALIETIPGVEIVGRASGGRQTLEMIRQLQPDVVTLDLSMPAGGGLTVLQKMRDEKLQAVVIVLTNYAYPEYEKLAKDRGAHAFLSKSGEFHKLTDLIANLAAKRRPSSKSDKQSS